MYNTTDSYKSKIYNVNHFLKVYINDAEIESRYIGDCKPSSTLFTNGEIELGSTPSQTVELQLYKTAVPDSITKIEIKSGITGEIVPIGIYNVDKISKVNDYTFSLTLSDNMTKFEFNYDGSKLVNDNDGKVKIIRVLQDMCSKAGVELGSTSFLNMNKVIAVYDNTVSARTYLSYIAEQAGGFAFIGRDGKLYIKSFKYALDKKIGEGKSIVIEKTNNLKAKTVIKGSHSQKTTQGINLFNPKITTKTKQGVTVSQEGKYRVKINGKATGAQSLVFDEIPNFEKGKYYTVTIKKISGSMTKSSDFAAWGLLFYPESSAGRNVVLLPDDTVKTTTFQAIGSGTKPYFWQGWVSDGSVVGVNSVFNNLVLEISIVEGNVAKDYEDYTGGQASPNPDYPQEIETVKDNVEIINRNKNLLSIEENTRTVNGLTSTCKNGKFTLKGTATTNWGFLSNTKTPLKLKAGEYTISNPTGYRFEPTFHYSDTENKKLYIDSTKLTFTLEKDVETITLGISGWKANDVINIECSIQLVAGKELGDWIAPKEETYILPIQQEMLEGDYIDTVEHHTWEKAILKGDEGWASTTNAKGLLYFCTSHFNSATVASPVISNMFQNKPLWLLTESEDIVKFADGSSTFLCMLSDTSIDTVAKFTAWLKSKYDEGNPVIIYYKLETPVDLQLTDEQKKVLKEIQNMDLYEDYTIIESEAEMQVNFARAEIPIKYFQNFEWGAKYKLSKIRYEDGIRVFEKGDDTGNTLYINPDNMFIVDQD